MEALIRACGSDAEKKPLLCMDLDISLCPICVWGSLILQGQAAVALRDLDVLDRCLLFELLHSSLNLSLIYSLFFL